MELKTGHAVAQVYQGCRAVVAYHLIASFKRREGDDAFRCGYKLVAITLEVEVIMLADRSGIECSLPLCLDALDQFRQFAARKDLL